MSRIIGSWFLERGTVTTNLSGESSCAVTLGGGAAKRIVFCDSLAFTSSSSIRPHLSQSSIPGRFSCPHLEHLFILLTLAQVEVNAITIAKLYRTNNITQVTLR